MDSTVFILLIASDKVEYLKRLKAGPYALDGNTAKLESDIHEALEVWR